MPNFKMELTAAGARIVAAGIAGKQPAFVALALGDGTPPVSGEQMEELAGEKMRLSLTSVRQAANGVYVTGQLAMEQAPEGFQWRELGVIARDPDTGRETLYSYGHDAAGGSIPGAGDNTKLETVIEVLIKTYGMGQEQYTVTVDQSLIYLTPPDLTAHNYDPAAHDSRFMFKADLVGGKVPPEQLPAMDYEPLGAVQQHDADPAAHGGLLAEVNAQLQNHEARITRLEDGLFHDIVGNPHTYLFDSLVGFKVVSGCWNKAKARLEC